MHGVGDILTLYYHLTASATYNDTISLNFSQVKLSDLNLNSVSATLFNGFIVVSGCELPGDVTDDGIVDIFDLSYIVKFANGDLSPTPEQQACADMNEDGNINSIDATACYSKILGSGTLLAQINAAAYMSSEEKELLLEGLMKLGVSTEMLEGVSTMLQSNLTISQLPKAFSLTQNSPNPFNPSTSISFSVPEGVRSEVKIEVFNMRGGLVKCLCDGEREAGSYTVFWDGKDSNGREVASGVYLYRMLAGEFVQTRKMVLLK